jgi:hypothetical protein
MVEAFSLLFPPIVFVFFLENGAASILVRADRAGLSHQEAD